MRVEVIIGGVCLGLAWFFNFSLRRQQEREKEEKRRARQASFLDKRNGLIEDLPQPEREQLMRIFASYYSEGREYSFLLKDGRSLQGGFRPLTDDYIQFFTSIEPIDFESIRFSIPITAVDLDTLTYLDFDAAEPEWQRFCVAVFSRTRFFVRGE